MTQKLAVDVWSDIVCPWCAIGSRRLDTALSRFSQSAAVEVVWHAFELDPSAPAIHDGSNAARLARKYGRTVPEAEAMIRNVSETAAKDGLDFRLLAARSGNTFDAHRLLQLALERGVQNAVKDRFFRGYMTEELPIGDHEVLVRLAAEAGLDAAEARAVLTSDRFGAEVRDDEQVARRLGITGVPFFVFGGRLAVSGAQPAEILLRALDQAWGDAASAEEDEASGAACGPDGCGPEGR
jgi:predicted DsbA family dithiol-disulfide isomerase